MEVGQDLANMAVKKVGVFTDSNLANLPPVKTALDSLTKYGVNYVLYDKVGQSIPQQLAAGFRHLGKILR